MFFCIFMLNKVWKVNIWTPIKGLQYIIFCSAVLVVSIVIRRSHFWNTMLYLKLAECEMVLIAFGDTVFSGLWHHHHSKAKVRLMMVEKLANIKP